MRFAAGLNPTQRRIVVGVSLIAAFLLTVSASFNYLLAPILETFDASETESQIFRQVPSIAALLVIFPAGALGARIGPRRFIVACALLFVLGSAVLAVAPSIAVATVGLLLVSVGRAAMFIVGLGYIGALVESKDGRASAFATFSMVLPLTYLVMPVLSGYLAGTVGWRWAVALTSLGGLAALVLALRMLPRDGDRTRAGEMWTPALAGLVLIGLVQGLNAASAYGWLSPQALVQFAAVAVGGVVLAIVMRRIAEPSLSLGVLKDGGVLLLLIVIVLLCLANLMFYTTMAFQYVFGLSSLEAAIYMMPAQLAAIGGAFVGGVLIRKSGIPAAGAVLIVGVALLLFASAIVDTDSPLWLPTLIVTVYAALGAGAGVPVTNAIMDRASTSGEGGASAWKSAATNVGAAVSVAFMSAIVVSAVGLSLEAQMQGTQAGETMSSQQMEDALSAINSGQSQADVAAQYSVPESDIEQLSQDQKSAFIAGYRAQGIVGGSVTLLMGLLFYGVARRLVRPQDLAARAASGDQPA